MTVNRFGSESVSYEGIGTNRKWTRIESYGAKFCENIVQATARDVLAEAMLRLEKKGFDIVCHIHDEVVLEVPEGSSSVEEVNEIMAVCPDWCEGLPLKAVLQERLGGAYGRMQQGRVSGSDRRYCNRTGHETGKT